MFRSFVDVLLSRGSLIRLFNFFQVSGFYFLIEAITISQVSKVGYWLESVRSSPVGIFPRFVSLRGFIN